MIDRIRSEVIAIVAEMEKRYGIVIPENEIGKIRSMADVLALVEIHSRPE